MKVYGFWKFGRTWSASLSYAYQSVWMFLCHNQFHAGKTIARRQNEKGVIRTKFKSYYFASFLKGTEDMWEKDHFLIFKDISS